MSSDTSRILFVCTGNVFRSMTAEWACKALASPLRYSFHSAGTKAKMDGIAWPHVSTHLQNIDLDTTAHRPRKLTPELINESDLVIAMNPDHQRDLRKVYGYHAPLFMEVAATWPYALPDACDLFSGDATDSPDARRHIAYTIDRIVSQAGRFVERLPRYLR